MSAHGGLQRLRRSSVDASICIDLQDGLLAAAAGPPKNNQYIAPAAADAAGWLQLGKEVSDDTAQLPYWPRKLNSAIHASESLLGTA